jgi:hypothetical protein
MSFRASMSRSHLHGNSSSIPYLDGVDLSLDTQASNSGWLPDPMLSKSGTRNPGFRLLIPDFRPHSCLVGESGGLLQYLTLQ